jgi:putative endonuclease
MQSRKGFLGAQAAQTSSKKIGDVAEDEALQYLQDRGLRLLTRNYRTPGRGGGEVDLIMRAADGTLVFVEVRKRLSTRHGGAAASVGWVKQKRIVRAAQHYLLAFSRLPPCRFDVVEIDAEGVHWLLGAFDAG